MTKHDVILFGEVCCDLIFSGIPSLPNVGEEIWAKHMELTVGGIMNTAAALSRLDLKVGLSAEMGSDIWGEMIVSKMRSEGVQLDYIQQYAEPYPQVTVVLNYRNDRSFISYSSDWNAATYERHLYEVVQTSDARIYHFSADKKYKHLIAEAKKLQKTVSLDTSWNEEWLKSAEIRQLISMSDIFMPNVKEARMITGKDDPFEALEELSKMVSVVVIKMGEQGAIGKANGITYTAEAIQTAAVDTTGAGDCFAAGFLYGWLQQKNIYDCLRIANYCGSQCVQSVGGFTNAPTLKEVMEYTYNRL
jgi:sugar/nucleoside kinase (ribokinase family)